MWLDADTLIRERSNGTRSLDDFAKAFYGGTDGPPAVVPYTRADIVAALNAVVPNDWEAFFRARIDATTAHPPLDGITRGGYTLVYDPKAATPDPVSGLARAAVTDWRFRLGARISSTGIVQDVIAGTPAARAGLTPAMTIVAIDERRFAPALLTSAVERAVKTKAPIVLLVDNHQTYQTLKLAYDGGPRQPSLQRATGPDLIDAVIAPRTYTRPAPAPAPTPTKAP
jgi:predicted metalloprotease with PDZ domain